MLMSPDRALARQRVLAEFGTVALRCGDRAELLRAAARQTALALGVDHTTVAIHRRETGDFLVEAGVGWPDDCPHWKVLPADPTSMAGRILAEGVSDRAIVAHDPDPDGPVPPGFGLLRLHGLRSTIAAPVVCAGRLVGVIEAASAGINDFEDDIHCLQGLASILGAALTRMAAEAERDRLVAELAEGERRYRFMAEMIPQVVWTATPDGRVDYYNRR
ncbi:MAG: cstS1, partial [Pseudomonadota bacterium]